MAFKVQGVNQIDIVKYDDISINLDGKKIYTVKFPGQQSDNLKVKLSQGCERCLLVNGNEEFIFELKENEK